MQEDPKITASFKELVYSNMIMVEAVVELLMQKNVITRDEVLDPHFRDELLPTNLRACAVICVYAGLNAVRTPWRCTPNG